MPTPPPPKSGPEVVSGSYHFVQWFAVKLGHFWAFGGGPHIGEAKNRQNRCNIEIGSQTGRPTITIAS